MRRSMLMAVATIAISTPPAAHAQERAGGTVTGTVTRPSDGSALAGVAVTVKGMGITAVTGHNGRYTLQGVPAGPQTLVFRLFGHRPREASIQVEGGTVQTLDFALELEPVTLSEVLVQSASRAPERIVEAPAAITVVDPQHFRTTSPTGQAPLVLATTPGIDVVQSGVNDFNVNARGFNSSLNRRVLVLQDGRDLAIAFLGSQEWNGLSMPLEDIGRLEVVRGPGSALYGANAFSGVISITTPLAREIPGGKVTLSGGEMSTMRADARHAGVGAAGRLGYRVNAGYYRSESWSRSRTARDTSDFRAEYGEASGRPVRPPNPGFEVRALNGQSVDPATGYAFGEPDDLENTYGSGRLDYYAPGGAIGTIEGGAARVQNELFITGIGRVQVTEALKPWVRAAWAAPRYNVMAWYSGRDSREPQYSLAAGIPLEEHSSIYHVEAQGNQLFASDRGRVVVGASWRQMNVDTEGTLMLPENDDRSDASYAAYGQVEYRLTPTLRAVAAARVDDGDLIETQFSPKGALVYSPSARHSFRVTVNRAFQTPNYSEFYLRVPAGAPTTQPATLETSLEGYFAAIRANFGADPSLPPTPEDLPWDFAASLQPLALGNAQLDVEKVIGYEVGYKGNLSRRLFVAVDLYRNRISDFVTDLLPGVNPAYPTYQLTDGGTDIPATLAAVDAYLAGNGIPASHPLRTNNAALQAGYGQLDAALVQTGLLATLPGGQRGIVVSYANAGRVTERGVELSAGYQLTPELTVDGTFTYFDFDEPEGTLAGDRVLPNTPRTKGTLGLAYNGAQGLALGITGRFVEGYDWATGVFAGHIPASQTVNLTAGHQISSRLRVHAIATNVFDQKRYQMYGGSVIGRRVLAGVTTTF